MKKIVSTILLVMVVLTPSFISCKKSEKAAVQDKPAFVFKTDAERDANSAALSKLIAKDKDWQALNQINFEFLDVVVKSNVPINSTSLNSSNPALQKLYSKEFLTKFEEAKVLAGRLNARYFQNSKQCTSCETMTEAKWKLFSEKVNSFRSDKLSYKQYQSKLGVKWESNVNSEEITVDQTESFDDAGGPNCNNWRFYFCASGCALMAATPAFAACMLGCIAAFC